VDVDGGIANGYFVGDLKNAQMERGGGQGKWEARGIVMETDNGRNDRGKEGGGGGRGEGARYEMKTRGGGQGECVERMGWES
jgi:hypothetical protein